jgi:pimeloyl-ACP methyl ester carboxylesterase
VRYTAAYLPTILPTILLTYYPTPTYPFTHQPTNPPPPPKMPSKTIILVPGSFSPSSFYVPLADPLRAAGLTVHLLDPPSYYTKKPGAPPTVYDDAAFVASFVRGLVDAGEEVILLAHSYGGMPTSQALEGLTVRERRAKGEKGGVARVGFITAVVPPVGKSVMEFMGTPAGGVQPYEADAVGFFLSFSMFFFSSSTAFLGTFLCSCSCCCHFYHTNSFLRHQLTHATRTAGSRRRVPISSSNGSSTASRPKRAQSKPRASASTLARRSSRR